MNTSAEQDTEPADLESDAPKSPAATRTSSPLKRQRQAPSKSKRSLSSRQQMAKPEQHQDLLLATPTPAATCGYDTPAGEQDQKEATNPKQDNVCAACGKPIRDRYLLEALDKKWHEDCLKCACCDCRLGEVGSSLYTRADKILCRRDFLRIFGQGGYCAACKKPIPPYELVMRAQEHAYHMDCFACQQCQYRFCVGDRFYLTERDRIICLMCQSESLASSGGSQQPASAASSAAEPEEESDAKHVPQPQPQPQAPPQQQPQPKKQLAAMRA